MARRSLLLAVFLIGAAALIAGAWWYFGGSRAGVQLAAYRIGQAAGYREAAREIALLEQKPDRKEALRELAASWGTGNQRFDFYLALRVSDPQSGEALRQAFSLELSWRPELLPRWAHYWRWRVKQSPADEIVSISEYLETLATAEPPRRLTWREVLNLQAVFAVTGQPELARRLAPDNWLGRYRSWRERHRKNIEVERPAAPFADWQGALPIGLTAGG